MKMKFVLFGLLAICTVFMAARPGNLLNDLYGSWTYVISDVPQEYQNGVMIFEEKDNNLVGFLGPDKSIPMKELETANGDVSFKLDFEGGEIKVKMVQKGDTLKGNLSTQHGEFPIVAVKQK